MIYCLLLMDVNLIDDICDANDEVTKIRPCNEKCV